MVLLLQMHLPERINVRFLLIVMYLGIFESLFGTVTGILLAVQSQMVWVKICGCLLAVGINMGVNLVKVEV